jgi:hypothetical protein
MGNSGGRTFWATIDRLSNQGNGVVEKDDGSHFIVGPVREEAVGKTVEVRMVGPNEAELVDSDLRKDVSINGQNLRPETFRWGISLQTTDDGKYSE